MIRNLNCLVLAEVAKVVPPEADLKNMYYTYVLYSERIHKHYVGYSSDIHKRIEHHNKGLNKWSKRGVPWKIVYIEEYQTRSEAIKREKFLKSGKGRELIKRKL